MNFYVIKCINLVLKPDILKKGYGGFIILSLFIIEIIFLRKTNLYSILKYKIKNGILCEE